MEQRFLVLLPFLLFVVGLPAFVVGQKVLGFNFVRLNRLALLSGGAVIVLEGAMVMYLLYWAWRVIKKNHFSGFLVK